MNVIQLKKWILVGLLFLGLTSVGSADMTYSKGPETAKVTILEFTDFQCPFCSRGNQTLQQLLKEYPNDIKVIYRSFPLSIHPDAPLAAEAALAAGAQGKFWEMHDLLFANQKSLKMNDLLSYAKTLGLDVKKFQKSLDGREFQKQVETDMAFGKMLKVSATPTFFINGNKITGAKAYPEFKNIIDTLLAGKELPKALEPNKDVPAAPVTNLKPNLSGTLNVKGSESAPVTIVEYSDFQCPFCSRVVPSLDKLFKAYPDKIRIVFKQYPLPFHANARPAAKAALAAGRQNKFWEMHDLLFANQTSLSETNFLAWAKQIGLDVDQFKKDLVDPTLETQIVTDEKEAQGFGISGTPSFIINGTKYVGAYPYEKFEQIIKAELEKK